MREIKFRGWDKVRKQWLGKWNDYICVGGDAIVHIKYAPNHSGGYSPIECRQLTWDEIKDLEIMQFTGLKDRNGKEIYEGDIVGNKYPCVIEWGTSKCAEFIAVGKDGVNYTLFNDGVYEVIGNIYENPDLLTRKDS